MPIVEENTYIIDIAYSPLVGGFAIVLNDGRAAFLTASTLRFDPNVSFFKTIFSWNVNVFILNVIRTCVSYYFLFVCKYSKYKAFGPKE